VVLADVTKRYGRRRRAVPALDQVSLSFGAGSFTAVLGVSGSGKSTLLQCAAGLERPSAGTVRLCGTDLAGLSQRRQAVLRRQRVGFVFQDLNLLPELTVEENIALPLRLDHRRAGRADIELAAARVGLGGGPAAAAARRTLRRPAAAGGDRPGADRPAGGDLRRRADRGAGPATAVGVLRLLRGAADGTTGVIVTHDPQVTRFCDRAVFLHDGRVDRVLADPEPAVALVNTLVIATVERRRALRLLGQVGASRGQVATAFGWHALFVTVTGVVAGAAAGAVTLVAVTKAATGSWVPFIGLAPAAGLVIAVAALVAGAVMIPFWLMSRREPALAAG
jgi:putative ABC transport system ATP-binding protein